MKNKIVWYILRKICKKLITQGYQHSYNLQMYYQIMREELELQFTEDNGPTLDDFSTVHFDRSLTHSTVKLKPKYFRNIESRLTNQKTKVR